MEKAGTRLKGARLIYLGIMGVVLTFAIVFALFTIHDEVTVIDYALFSGLIMAIIYPLYS
jgi:hypothetical protein